MKRDIQGRYIRVDSPTEAYQAFVPNPLPPNPKIQYEAAIQSRIDKANLFLGRLDALSHFLPEVSLFLYVYVRKEALVSSQIEGTQSSLSDLLLFESEERPGVPIADVLEVSNYVAALNHGLNRIREGFPLTSRLIREIHNILLSKGRGSEKQPGEFRHTQNWIGGSRPGNAIFVPPPHYEIAQCMSDLDKFINDPQEPTSALVKSALVHAQFETIHPFLDGNGRIGRLLIPLIFCAENILAEPLLYLSLFFKRDRNQYYELLQKVRLEGDWESWLIFFLDGVFTTAEQAVATAKRSMELFKKDRERIEKLGRSAGTSLRVHAVFQKKILLSIPALERELKISYPAIKKSLLRLQAFGIVREISGRRRNKIYVYHEYFDYLVEGTEPLKPEPANL